MLPQRTGSWSSKAKFKDNEIFNRQANSATPDQATAKVIKCLGLLEVL